MKYPIGFFSFATNVGIKDDSLDFAVIHSESPCRSAAVFTKNNYPGAPVIVGREVVRNGWVQTIVVNSKNSNVATGNKGIEDAKLICKTVAESLGIDPSLVFPSSTGVIGVPLPMEKILPVCRQVKSHLTFGNLERVANAIMTTDKTQKIATREITKNGRFGVIYGIAKGAGMIDPNMATMLCYILSDFMIEEELYPVLKMAVDRSFNCLSIDSDTSTSDTVLLMTSGRSGKLDLEFFTEVLTDICKELARKIAKDGEGATKLIILNVINARDEMQARKIGKSIINSPLVKTAIYGGDPNWGRLIMAIGKVFDEPIPYETLDIRIGDIPVKSADEKIKKQLANYLKAKDEVRIDVFLNTGKYQLEFYGCDLTEEYVSENAYYTT